MFRDHQPTMKRYHTDFDRYLNRQVTLITNDDAEYAGILARIDEESSKLVLKDVNTEGSKLLGPQFFHSDDIKSVEVHQDLRERKDDVIKGGQDLDKWKAKVLRRKIHQPHLSRLRNLDTDELTTRNISNIFSDDTDEEEGLSQEEDVYEDFYKDGDIVLINRICDKFKDAITYIMDQAEIGVTFRGVDGGRQGILSLIEIATDTDVIVFDIVRLGREAFTEGLNVVFHSHKITKVIHDCRWISDLLYHQYNVTLNNVFDTQVANAHVYSLCHGGDWPRFVDSLASCLQVHLNLPDTKVFVDKFRERSQEKDQAVWVERPLPDMLLRMTCLNVRHLLRLQYVLIDKMLLVFKVGVKLYLRHVRDAPHGNVDRYRANRHLLPASFIDMQKYVDYELQNSEEFDYQKKERSWVRYDSKGFRENLVGISDKSVISSHDSIWHRSEEYYKKFRARNKMPCEDDKYNSTTGVPPESLDPPRRRDPNRNNPYPANTARPADYRSPPPNNSGDASATPPHANNPVKPLTSSPLQVSTQLSTTSPVTSLPISPGRGRGAHILAAKSTSPDGPGGLASQTPPPNNVTSPSAGPSPTAASSASSSANSSPSSTISPPKVSRSQLLQQLAAKQRSKEQSKEAAKSQQAAEAVSTGAVGSGSEQDDVDAQKLKLDKEREAELFQKQFDRLNNLSLLSQKDMMAHKKRLGSASESQATSVLTPSALTTTKKKSLSPNHFGLGGSGASSSSETEGPVDRHVSVLDNMRPAGHQDQRMNKKKQKRLEEQMAYGQELSGIEARYQDGQSKMLPSSSSCDLDDDFGMIPNQASLRRSDGANLLQTPANIAGLGDPFSAYGGSHIEDKKSSNSDHDDAINDFEKSETFQSIQQAAKIVMKSKLGQSRLK